MGGAIKSIASTVSNGLNQFHDQTIGDVFGYHDKKPVAPPPDPNLTQIKDQQMNMAKDFRANLEGNKSSAAQNLQQQSNNQMNYDLSQSSKEANRRGLLYSGINAGNQGAIRGDASAKLGRAISQSNSGYDSQADQLDSDAVSTAVGIQQSQQQIQNMLYSQAQSQLAGQNQMKSSALGTGLLALLL